MPPMFGVWPGIIPPPGMAWPAAGMAVVSLADSTMATVRMLPNDRLDPLFTATVQATEEAVTNAMVAAETMTGADSIRAHALPHARLVEILRKYNRLEKTGRMGK